jgi:hypothetical protein
MIFMMVALTMPSLNLTRHEKNYFLSQRRKARQENFCGPGVFARVMIKHYLICKGVKVVGWAKER